MTMASDADAATAVPEPAVDISNGSSIPKVVDKAKQGPPPEAPQSVATRRLIVLSFWVVVALLGLPMWWKTTEVYRSELPYAQMYDWAEGRSCHPSFPLQIAFDGTTIPQPQSDRLLSLTQHALDDLNHFPEHHLRLSPPVAPGPPALSVHITTTPESLTSPTVSLLPNSRTLSVVLTHNMLPTDAATSSPLATFIAQHLHNIFLPEQAAVAHTLGLGRAITPINALTTLLEQQKTRAFKWYPEYHLTFSLMTPTHTPSQWDVAPIKAAMIRPLLQGLGHIANFTLDTQIQNYATFSKAVEPTYSEAHQAWFLDDNALGSFINAAEWPLSPSIGEGPTINFLTYVPSPDQTPLYINTSSNPVLPGQPIDPDATPHSWLVPQWGAVYILNPPTGTSIPGKLLFADLQQPFLQFATHLLSLVGLPAEPRGSILLRADSFSRTLALTLLKSASSTMGALARLTLSMPSIAIPSSVATSVDRTLRELENACGALNRGAFAEALEAAKTAEVEAEKAFFERSMVGQVYFPEEHKVAVYLPLLGPVAVPLILSLLKEVKAFVAARKARGRGP